MHWPEFDIMTQFYDSSVVRDMPCKGVISHWTQYRMMAVDKISGTKVPYLVDYMKFGRLWITETYPEIWADRDDRTVRFISHEGYMMDFRRISDTSVYLFLRDFNDKNEVMVISGSFQLNENKNGESRKLGLYRYFFSRLGSSLNFRIAEAPGLNAFFIMHPDCTIDVEDFVSEYKIFKNR